MIHSYLTCLARRLKRVPVLMRYREWLITQGTVICICGMFGLLVTGLFIFWGGVILCGAFMLFVGIIAWYLSPPNPPQGGIPLINTVATESRVYAAFSFAPVISRTLPNLQKPIQGNKLNGSAMLSRLLSRSNSYTEVRPL